MRDVEYRCREEKEARGDSPRSYHVLERGEDFETRLSMSFFREGGGECVSHGCRVDEYRHGDARQNGAYRGEEGRI